MGKQLLLKNIDHPEINTISGYIKLGGYRTLDKVLSKMSPDEVT